LSSLRRHGGAVGTANTALVAFGRSCMRTWWSLRTLWALQR